MVTDKEPKSLIRSVPWWVFAGPLTLVFGLLAVLALSFSDLLRDFGSSSTEVGIP